MNLTLNVKKLPQILSKFPYRGFTFSSLIFFRSDIYENLISSETTPENVGILIHEQTHAKRSKGSSWIIWGIKYWFFPKFRFNEEIEATKEHMRYLKKRKIKFNIEQRAQHLSSWLYLWSTSFEDAKLELKRVWNSLN